MSEYECNNNDNDTGSLSVQVLTEEIKEILKTVIPSKRIEGITSIALILNKDIVLYRANQVLQQPVKLEIFQDLSTSTTYEVRRSNGKCYAFEVIHYSDGRPDTINEYPEPAGKFDNSKTHYYSVGHRSSDNKCCIYVQDVINIGGGGLQLGHPREWLVEK
ncbi:MAG: hypothetical protein KA524_04300 [Nitrosomonas sp.]|nr:hypothetical protein [Nitrosomonas sp.]MBP6075495.1 hypothetical protein [Nitrosomonas sp.]